MACLSCCQALTSVEHTEDSDDEGTSTKAREAKADLASISLDLRRAKDELLKGALLVRARVGIYSHAAASSSMCG